MIWLIQNISLVIYFILVLQHYFQMNWYVWHMWYHNVILENIHFTNFWWHFYQQSTDLVKKSKRSFPKNIGIPFKKSWINVGHWMWIILMKPIIMISWGKFAVGWKPEKKCKLKKLHHYLRQRNFSGSLCWGLRSVEFFLKNVDFSPCGANSETMQPLYLLHYFSIFSPLCGPF